MTCRAICMQSPEKNMAAEMISSVYDQRRMPNFLANVAPEAEVHSGFLDILDSFQQEQGGREPLAETVKELTGGPTVCPHPQHSLSHAGQWLHVSSKLQSCHAPDLNDA